MSASKIQKFRLREQLLEELGIAGAERSGGRRDDDLHGSTPSSASAISAIYSLLALGLIVIYSGSGVLNFSQAAMATLAAYLYCEMPQHPRLGLLAGVPRSPSRRSRCSASSSTTCVMRPLRDASTLAKAIAQPRRADPDPGRHRPEVGTRCPATSTRSSRRRSTRSATCSSPPTGSTSSSIAVALTAALWAGVPKFTPIGPRDPRERREPARGRDARLVAARARDDDLGARRRARRRRRRDLIAPITGINPEEMPFFILPVLAAALVGGFTSFWITLAAAFAIGITQSEFTHYVSTPAHLGPQADAAVPRHHRAARGPRARGCRSGARWSSGSPSSAPAASAGAGSPASSSRSRSRRSVWFDIALRRALTSRSAGRS